ncbi:MAG: sugar phosphate isomerase/epimerase family protein [Armatimonadota bacterium]
MKQRPLRLGSSTSSLIRSMPGDFSAIVQKSSSYTPEDHKRLCAIASECGEKLAKSDIKSIEYFVNVQMLEAGLNNPMVEMFKSMGRNVEMWSVHAPFSGVDLASPDKELRAKSVGWVSGAGKIAHDLGAKVLVVHAALEIKVNISREDRVLLAADSLRQVADVCKPLGVTVAVEALPRTCIGNCAPELLFILDKINRPNTGICLDVNHLIPASALSAIVRILGERIITLHISDHDDVDERHWLPKKGVINWPGLVQALREIKYKGPFMYEVGLSKPTFDEAIETLQDNYNDVMKDAAV